MGYSVKLLSLLFVIVVCIVKNTYGFSEGDIRLIGGYSKSEGTVLIYHDRKWGSICDSSWDIRDARVVCRQLGYSGARRAVGRSHYGIGRCHPEGDNSDDRCDMRWMSGLRCTGYEKELSQCNFRGWGTMHRRCHAPARSAGVECVGDYQPVYRPPYYRYPSTRRTTTRRTTRTTTTTTTTTTTKPTTTTTTTTTPKPTTTTTTTPKPTTTTTTTPVPTTTTTTTPSPTTTSTTTTTTTTTPVPTTTTTTKRPTTRKPTTQKPTTTEKTVPHYKSLQQDEQYISNDINFDEMPNNIQVIPDVQPAQLRTQAPTTTSTPRPTTTTSTPRPTTTTTTPRPTTTSTSKPTTTPRVPHPFVTTRRPQHRTTRRTPDIPDVQIGVWFKDEVLKKWVLYMHTGMVLIAEAGHSPSKVTENEYLRKRNEKMMGEIVQADESFSNVIENETPVEGGANQINLGQDSSRNGQNRNPENEEEINNVISGGNMEHQHRHRHGHDESQGNHHINRRLQIRLRNGRSRGSGRLEVMPPNSNRWGVICGDKWSLKETMVACRQLGVGYGQQGTRSSNVFGGQNMDKHFATVTCVGNEESLKDCQWSAHEGSVSCSSSTSVAGIICARRLPDLEPDIRMLQSTAFLQDRHLYYLTCAMEEKCLSSSAYEVQRRQRSWGSHTRRLLRFSSVVHNKGTADFRPVSTVDQWEWHACHRHYHSMDIFAHYDVLDTHGNRVAEGLKASFCLEDSKCERGVYPRYECAQIGNQGISVGCSDNYMHDIDCQWIDMTDVPHSNDYTIKIEVNPHMLVPEISFDNNVITCKLHYSGYAASITNCKLGSLL